jgi:hypothetical protein
MEAPTQRGRDEPDTEITPEVIIDVIRDIAWHYFPLLAPDAEAKPRSG